MTRFLDWPERLAEFLRSRRRAPFQWGVNDCALFAADAAHAITGADPAAEYRGYSDEVEALRLIKAAGGMRALVALPEKPVAFAQRGDGVLALIDGRETFGVCVGAQYAAPGAGRLVFRPMTEAVAAFEV